MGSIKAFIEGILHGGKKKKTSSSTGVKKYSYTFKGESAWDAAAREYRRLAGKSEETELTEEEKKKILDDTMMPLSYFFGWACERDLIGEGFINEFADTDRVKLPEEIKNGKITPLEALAGLDHYFSYEWLNEDAQYIFRFYFDTNYSEKDQFFDKDAYFYDYYEFNGMPEDRYYCIEYSAEAQKKIDQRLDEYLDERHKKSQGSYYLKDLQEKYYLDEEEDENVVEIHSDFFGNDLPVLRSGEIRKGEFPEDYALKCLKCLEEMPQKEWHRLERWLVETYGGEAEDFKMDHFRAHSIHIYEPQAEGDLAFMIDGGADYEEEHGISFTIRNGILLDWSYSGESGDPYDEELIERYKRYAYGRDRGTGAKEIDFEQIIEQKDLDALVKEGKLIRTLLVPEWLGGADTEDNTVCVTPITLAQIEQIHKRLKMVRAFAATIYPDWEFHVDVKPEYCENADGTKGLVPMCIDYSGRGENSMISIHMVAPVWE